MFTVAFSETRPYVGHGHWRSAVYAAWDSIMAVGLSLGCVALFRALLNGGGRIARFLSRHSYTVYVIHTPIVVYLAYALRSVTLAPLPKAALAALIIVPAVFTAAWIVRKLPCASEVL
jgi:peptidoglycan/LPS O-acetylase OafA/YrhL